MGQKTRGRPEPKMKFPQRVGEVLREQVVLESESIDRMYLNVYAPQLQPTGGVVWYLRGHFGATLCLDGWHSAKY